jgi:hypothetical protein
VRSVDGESAGRAEFRVDLAWLRALAALFPISGIVIYGDPQVIARDALLQLGRLGVGAFVGRAIDDRPTQLHDALCRVLRDLILEPVVRVLDSRLPFPSERLCWESLNWVGRQTAATPRRSRLSVRQAAEALGWSTGHVERKLRGPWLSELRARADVDAPTAHRKHFARLAVQAVARCRDDRFC